MSELKWRTGPVPINGWYWLDLEQGLIVDQVSPGWPNTDGIRWAGPLIPPEPPEGE